jgi:hypothetical protein
VKLVRHRQTKEPETDRPSLKPPRHISTLHGGWKPGRGRYSRVSIVLVSIGGFQTSIFPASRHPSSSRSGRSHDSPPPHAGRNNAGINQAARGVFAARPGRGPRRGTAPEGKPSRLRWTEVTLSVLRPRSTPLGKLDPVIGLFEGSFLGRLSDLAQESRISRRLAWPRTAKATAGQ